MSAASTLNVIVVGAPGLGVLLEATDRFTNVLSCPTTAALQQAIKDGALGRSTPNQLVFVFTDRTVEDVPGVTVEALVTKLCANKFKVVVLETSPRGRQIAAANPSVGLLPVPVTVNMVLAAVKGLGFNPMEPVAARWAEQHTPFDDSGEALALLNGGDDSDPLSSVAAFLDEFDPGSPAAVSGLRDEPDVTASGWTASPEVSAWETVTDEPVVDFEPVQVPPTNGWDNPWDRPGDVPDVAPRVETSVAPLSQTSGWGEVVAPAGDPFGQPDPTPASTPNSSWGGWTPADEPESSDIWGPADGWSTVDTSAEPTFAVTDSPSPLQGDFQSAPGNRRGVVIGVVVAKGGAGKSTLTLNLAVWLGLRSRASGKRVCVVDANFQQADIGKMINAVRPNIADLANHPEDQNPQRIGKHLLQRRDLNTDFLLGPSRLDEANPMWITPALYSHAVESLRHLYDYVFIDTPVAEFHHSLFREFVLPHTDFLLVPITPNLATMMNADAWLRSATADHHQGGGGYDRARVGVVLNMEEDGVGYDEDQVRSELANWNFLGSVPASKAWRRAANEGEIVATRNYAEVNEAFGRILAQVTGDRSLLPVTAAPATKKGLLGRLIKR